jgi:acetyltransferase-like isoleucine patch superfamily enzyme
VNARRAPAALGRIVNPANWAHALMLVNFYGYAHVQQRKLIQAGPGLRMSPSVSMRNGQRITLGREVHIGERSCLWAGDTHGRITLGDNALLGPEVFITASNYSVDAGKPVMYQDKIEADVVIGADVWLGVRVIVLPGVEIGDGAVVGAGSVVTKSLPAQCIAVGSPAKVVGWRPGFEGAISVES